jgi:hypothetical protein
VRAIALTPHAGGPSCRRASTRGVKAEPAPFACCIEAADSVMKFHGSWSRLRRQTKRE